jgi:hypothetical protein
MRQLTKQHRMLPVLVVVGFVVVVVVLLTSGSQRRSGPSLDPRSTDFDGSRAAILLMRGSGLEVSTGDVGGVGAADTVLVLSDDLDERGWDQVEDLARGGRTVVIALPFSPLSPMVAETTTSAVIHADGRCDLGAGLDQVRELDVPIVRSFVSSAGSESCLTVGEGELVRVDSLGTGRVIAVGTGAPWRNDHLALADNAALVVGVLSLGGGSVHVLEREPFGTGTESLTDLVPRWVFTLLALSAASFVSYAVFKAIRFGRVVEEQPVTRAEASQLILAQGQMLADGQNTRWAGEALHERWLVELRVRTGWDGADVGTVLALLDANREQAALLREVIERPAVDDEQALIDFARALASARVALGWLSVDNPGESSEVQVAANREIHV